MHEFSLKDPGLNDFVICEIRNKEAGAVATEKRVHVRDEETPDSNHVPSTKKACIAGNQQVGFSNQVSVSPDLTASSYHQTNTLSKASVHQYLNFIISEAAIGRMLVHATVKDFIVRCGS
ncbi:hypothetical protein V6N13_053746 [Hibiscus sabdariffa]|uniref:Uncharacterized protein n=1 Tax=Hibiscus sabdariffa TaxID=183260 RepID=A0ABR2T7H5_9ROSI